MNMLRARFMGEWLNHSLSTAGFRVRVSITPFGIRGVRIGVGNEFFSWLTLQFGNRDFEILLQFFYGKTSN